MSTRSLNRLPALLLTWLEHQLAVLAAPHRPDHVMRCEEYVEPGRLVVRAELAGLDPDEDVEVTVAEGVMRIRARRRWEHRDGRAGRSEFFYGEMVRTLALPAGADEDGVTASYVDGILEVVVPVGEGASGSPGVPVARRPAV